MKFQLRLKPFLFSIALAVIFQLKAQVGVGTNSPKASAILDVESTSKGFLPPRMTTAQRDNIVSPEPGLTIYNTTMNCLQWWNGTIWYDGCTNSTQAIGTFTTNYVFCSSATTVVNITNPSTGKIWMDRNLGATQAATSATDVNAYGDLFQWGRYSDGHQCRTSSTTSTLSTVNQPSHVNYILSPNPPFDWRSPQNSNLWQGVNGLNNPCPYGYRIPTELEWEAERASWSTSNNVGAFLSPLKLTIAGSRNPISGSLTSVGSVGLYWSSTINSNATLGLNINSSNAVSNVAGVRGEGYSVRCIKD